MKMRCLVILFTTIFTVLLFTACGQPPAEQERDTEQTVEVLEDNNSPDADIPIDDKESKSLYNYNENATVFDFAELLAVDDYPYYECTVNQLINKFGEPEEIVGWDFPSHESIRVEVAYADMRVEFYPVVAEKFSCNEKEAENGSRVTLKENDKNLELHVMAIRIFEGDRSLPRGIEIGVSTEAQIVAAYGEEPFSKSIVRVYDFTDISYRYAFSDKPDYIGEITYLFDNNEDILTRVIISWGPGE